MLIPPPPGCAGHRQLCGAPAGRGQAHGGGRGAAALPRHRAGQVGRREGARARPRSAGAAVESALAPLLLLAARLAHAPSPFTRLLLRTAAARTSLPTGLPPSKSRRCCAGLGPWSGWGWTSFSWMPRPRWAPRVAWWEAGCWHQRTCMGGVARNGAAPTMPTWGGVAPQLAPRLPSAAAGCRPSGGWRRCGPLPGPPPRGCRPGGAMCTAAGRSWCRTAGTGQWTFGRCRAAPLLRGERYPPSQPVEQAALQQQQRAAALANKAAAAAAPAGRRCCAWAAPLPLVSWDVGMHAVVTCLPQMQLMCSRSEREKGLAMQPQPPKRPAWPYFPACCNVQRRGRRCVMRPATVRRPAWRPTSFWPSCAGEWGVGEPSGHATAAWQACECLQARLHTGLQGLQLETLHLSQSCSALLCMQRLAQAR